MYVLNADIQIGGKRFNRVNEVRVESSAEVLEDTCTIILPATARLERQGVFISEVETTKEFKVGDPVVVMLGYNGDLREEFRGYVSKIKPGTPLTVECVDEIWTLRRRNLAKAFRSINMKTLIEYIIEGTQIKVKGQVPEIELKPYTLKNVTAAAALQKIKDDYGFHMYLRGTDLFVGLTSATDSMVVKYEIGTNVIQNDLEWVSENDTRIKIKAVHIKKDNTKVEEDYGDEDGELRTLYFYNVSSQADLKRLAEAEARKYRYSGFKGGLTAFLLPFAQVGNIARLTDAQFAERAGDYLIDKITTTYGTSGGRRKIELGLKVSANG